jgi:hypothetical protein
MRRMVDISVPLKAGIASDPPGYRPEIDYYTHADTVEDVIAFFPGMASRSRSTPRPPAGHARWRSSMTDRRNQAGALV